MKILPKILLSILATAALLFGGLFVFIIVSLFGGGTFYMAMVFVIFVVLWLFLLMQIWNLLKQRIRYISVATAVAMILICVAGFEINRAYHNSFEQMDEREVDLTLYDPFRADTLAASLSEPSTLGLIENLPRLDGATALYPVYAGFVKAVYPESFQNETMTENAPQVIKGMITPEKPDIDMILACSGTEAAYMRLIAGATDIIFVAGPSDGQLQMAKDAGVELNLTPIGREAFVFFVNSQNPVDKLSTSDIQRIYSGDGTNWSEFGGGHSSIRAFQRPKDSGSQTALIQFMGNVPLMAPPQDDVAGGMGGMIQRVSAYRNYNNAIGYSFLFYADEMVKDNKIKLLEINDIAPTRENVANRTYPYAAEFYAVTAETTNPNVEAFIQWILSEQGQYLIEKTGYTPFMSGFNQPNQ